MVRGLILGASGKLGSAVYKNMLENGINIRVVTRADIELGESHLEKIFYEFEPDFVFNGVAKLGIDPCESRPDLAYKLNVEFVVFLSLLCNKVGALFINISTDAVFPDAVDRDFSYVESSLPAPLNVYGKTKYIGEQVVQILCASYYIIRVSVLFGDTWRQEQFVEKMLLKIMSGQNISVSDDIICSPCYSTDVADGIYQLLSSSAKSGIYHLVNDGNASLYELMSEISSCLGCGKDVVQRGSYKDFPHVGRKNLVTPLASERNLTMRGWRDAVRAYVTKIDFPANLRE